jgi:hypothetical protein
MLFLQRVLPLFFRDDGIIPGQQIEWKPMGQAVVTLQQADRIDLFPQPFHNRSRKEFVFIPIINLKTSAVQEVPDLLLPETIRMVPLIEHPGQ